MSDDNKLHQILWLKLGLQTGRISQFCPLDRDSAGCGLKRLAT